MKKEKSSGISKALLKNYFGDSEIANFERRERPTGFRIDEPRNLRPERKPCLAGINCP
jgi:hypothetical protein